MTNRNGEKKQNFPHSQAFVKASRTKLSCLRKCSATFLIAILPQTLLIVYSQNIEKMFPLLFNQYFWENFFGSSPSASFKAIFLCLADTSRIKWCGITELTTKGSHEALLHQKKKTRKEGGPDNTLGILKTFKMLNLLLIILPIIDCLCLQRKKKIPLKETFWIPPQTIPNSSCFVQEGKKKN